VLKKKEEIENIYKEEDKKKERLKLEYNAFVQEMENKIQEIQSFIRQEKALCDEFNLNKLQKKSEEVNPIQEQELFQKIGKRKSIDIESEDDGLGSQPLKIELKK
jgi:hypothetical protein